MLQNTTRSMQQDHCSLWKQSLRPIARLALTLMAVLFMVGLSFAFVNQNNVAHAAEIQSMNQPATSVQPVNTNETTGSATTASDDSMMSMNQMKCMMHMMHMMSSKYVTINGDVIMIVLKNVNVGKELEVELESHSRSYLRQ